MLRENDYRNFVFQGIPLIMKNDQEIRNVISLKKMCKWIPK